MRVLRTCAVALGVAAGLVSSQHAVPAAAESPTMTEFDGLLPSSHPTDIALGPDGRVWFTQATGLGAITTGGTITNYPLPGTPGFVTAGSDGNLWASGPGLLRRVTTTGAATTFTLPAGHPTWGNQIGGLVLGPDGNVWYTRRPATVGKITPGGAITEYAVPLDQPDRWVMPEAITVGPDGALWFTENWNTRVGRVSTAGTFTMFPLPAGRDGGTGITTGPDGNLWVGFGAVSVIARITPTTGAYAEFPGPQDPAFATAADGRLWYGSQNRGGIGTIAPDGTVTDHGGAALRLTRGPGSTLWYTSPRQSVGRITLEPDPRGEFTPLTPARILDTRSGLGRPGSVVGPVGAGESIAVQVTGRGGVPATGASAVVLNATVTSPTASSYVSVYPAGGTVPVVSSLNVDPGTTVANMVTVALGDGGQVGVFNAAGTSAVILDVVGYYADGGGPLGARFVGTVPQRALDTRDGTGGVPAQPVGPGGQLRVRITGVAGVPATGVTAVVVNVTATAPTATTWLTVYPDDTARPDASSLNLAPGTTVPNLVTVRVPPSGLIDIFNAAGSTHLIADVMGYYTTQLVTNEGRFIPVTPQRVYDSRVYDGSRLPIPLPGGVTTIATLDRNDELATTGASSAVLNLTVTETGGDGWLTVWPGDDCALPPSSNLNYRAGQTIPNSVITRLANAYVCDALGPYSFATYKTTSTHVIVDLFGFFTTRAFAFDGD